MNILKSFILVFVLAVTGCASNQTSQKEITSTKPALTLSQEDAWNILIGKWYGSQPTKEGGYKQEIMERFPEGTYKITFRVYDKNGQAKEQTEVGHWGVSGPIYFTIFLSLRKMLMSLEMIK